MAGRAGADPVLFEYGRGVALRPATDLAFGTCDMHVELDGAIADVVVHRQLRNTGDAPLAAAYELALPEPARVIGVELGGAALGVPTQHEAIVDNDPAILGIDPVIVRQLGSPIAGRAHYRAQLQPIDPGQTVTIMLRWTAPVAIHDDALHVVLPGGPTPCAATFHATPGSGAVVHALHPGAAFTLGADDVELAADLAIAGGKPIAWLQTAPLADGFTAQALTVIAPSARAQPVTPPHVVLVIDTSRSMELVGRPRVRALVQAIGAALPAGAQLEAIAYDHAADRLLGAWQPATPATLAALDAALAKRGAGGGSNPAAAFALAHDVLGATTGGLVIALTDGAFGDLADDALVTALDPHAKGIDLYALVMAPERMPAPAAHALRAAVTHFGGSFVELDGDAGDLAAAARLRPAWVDLAANGGPALPFEVRAGEGVVAMGVTRFAGAVQVTGRSESSLKVTARPAPAAPIAPLVLAAVTVDHFRAFVEATAAAAALEHAQALHPSVGELTDLAVLARTGRVAADRRKMVAGGGPYTRSIALADPTFDPVSYAGPGVTGGSALDRGIVERLLVMQLQPRVFVCYERALGRVHTLAGTATFELELGRGEVSRAKVAGLADPAFDACLLDAAYSLEPPLPTPGVNIDDRVLVHYPLTFTVRADKPFVVAGDADSSSPIDIDSVQGGVPRGPMHVDPSTPLSGLPPP